MPVVGSAEVLIRPTFSNFQKDIDRQMRGAGLQSGRVGGSALGSTLKKWGKRAAITAGAAVATGLGSALTLGFQRLTAIENAEAKLRGLGHSAEEVEGIMKNALDAVKGTAFGLDEAAGLAGVMVASGVEPGKELERVLGLVADSATIAGTGLDDMGLIWGKVAAKGKVDGQIVNQMLERQIPILDMLGEHYGVTAAEAADMVSQGKVSFEDFATVMEDSVSGAALESGDTTVGAFKNMKAALSRFGVAMLEDVFPMFRDAFVGITDFLDNATEGIKPFGEAFGTWIRDTALPAIQEFGSWLKDDLWPVLKDVGEEVGGAFSEAWESISGALADAGLNVGDLKDKFSGGFLTVLSAAGSTAAFAVEKLGDFITYLIDNKDTILTVASALTGIALAFKGLQTATAISGAVSGGLQSIGALLGIGSGAGEGAGLLGKVGGAARFAKFGIIGALIGGLAYFLTQTETGKKVVAAAWEWIQKAIAKVVEWWETTAAPFLSGVWDVVKDAAGEFFDWWDEHVSPVFDALGELADAIWGEMQKAAGAAATIFGALAALWSALWDRIKQTWSVVGEPIMAVLSGAWEALKLAVAGVWENIKTTIETALGVIESIIRAVAAALRGDWDQVWFYIKQAVDRAWEGIKKIISNSLDTLKKIFGVALEALKKVWSWVWDQIKARARAVWDWIKQHVFEAIRKKIADAIAWFGNLRDRVVAAWNALRDRLRDGWNNIKSWVFDKLKAGIEGVRSFFADKVARIKSIWSGLKDGFRTVYDWVKTNVIDRFKGTLDGLLEKVRTIRDRIGDAWRGIANKFRSPINWVLDKVWNNGIASAFNKAAGAIGISTRLPDSAQIPAFARGGYHRGGWALVGEEGPELVNFSRPGRVYTAAETQGILSAPGPVGDLGGTLSDIAGVIGDVVGTVTGWVRGGLAAAAGALLNPIKTLIGNTVGQWGTFGSFAGDVAKTAIDKVIDWIKGKDDEYSDDGTAPPLVGGWRRPSSGPITSEFGPRWGSFHSGIDVAGGGPTYAARAGQVVKTGWNIGPGRTGIGILLSHGGGTYTYYGHNPPGGVKVSAGDSVESGQRIGTQGATGNVTGTHVHFELHRGGAWRAVNPRQLGVFDQGGLLAPGAMAINLGSKPEPVLTPNQWDALTARGGGAGQEFNFNGPITTVDVDAMARAVARKQRDAMAVYAPAMGGVRG